MNVLYESEAYAPNERGIEEADVLKTESYRSICDVRRVDLIRNDIAWERCSTKKSMVKTAEVSVLEMV